MEILVTDPGTGSEIKMFGEQREGTDHTTWDIDYPSYGSFTMIQENGVWRAENADGLDESLIEEVGAALHPLNRYNPLT